MRFTTASEMAEIDRNAVDEYGLTESALMENAGQLTARHIRRQFLDDSSSRVTVLCGSGHNGADGMVVARWLDQWGYSVSVTLLHPYEEYEGLPADQLTSIRNRKDISVEVFSGDRPVDDTDVYVDALLGTGLSGDPRPPYDEVIKRLNHQSSPVTSVDVPSGLNGDDNRPYDPCVQAEMTVTYGLPKLGTLLEPGYSFVGYLIAQEIGFPRELYDELASPRHLISPVDVARSLPGRYPISHKGSAGRVTIIAGSQQYTGAPFLVGNAAAGTGAGLTSLIGPEQLATAAGRHERDLIFPFTTNELLEDDFTNRHRDFLQQQDAFVVGPGLTRSDELRSALTRLLPSIDVPVVLDADGLNNLQDDLDVLEDCEEVILTPHPGEASRLLDASVQSITSEPVKAVKRLVERTDQTVILKSSRPLVGHPDGSISVNVTGTAALAKGGTGDVLSGIIGGLLAQQVHSGAAACLGLYLHGAAGRRAAEALDTISVRPTDILDRLSGAINSLEDGGVPEWFPVKTESQHREVLTWTPYPN